MAWTYLKFDTEGERLDEAEHQLPPGPTVYLAFDVCRWAVVIGFTERGGFSSFLGPNVDDDCCIVAFAPLSEKTNPDEDYIRANTPWSSAQYPNPPDIINLLR